MENKKTSHLHLKKIYVVKMILVIIWRKKPDNDTETKKLISDWSDKNNYLIHYRK